MLLATDINTYIQTYICDLTVKSLPKDFDCNLPSVSRCLAGATSSTSASGTSHWRT